ncbi:MAG: efflux RND transporter periplasmic adaptor subunit, partial [Pirellulaceae bacterium]
MNQSAPHRQSPRPPRSARRTAPPRQGKGFRRYGRTALASLAVIVALALATLALSHRADSDIDRLTLEEAMPVSTLTVQAANSYEVTRRYTGTIVAKRKSDLGFELDGKLIQLFTDQGDTVEQSAPLARLDTAILDRQREELVAQRDQARAVLDELIAGPRAEAIAASRAAVDALAAQVKLLTNELGRHEELVRTSSVAISEYDTVRFNLQSRQAELQQARHRLDELVNGTRQEQIAAQQATVNRLSAAIGQVDVQLSKSTLLAPFAGTIAGRHVDEGTVVGAGAPVFRLVEHGQLEAWIGLPAHVATRLTPGDSQIVEVDGQSYTATVEGLFPEIDPATQTRKVIFNLESSTGTRLVDGQVVRVSVSDTIQDAGFWLPVAALQKDARGLWTCLVLEPHENG